MSEKGGISAPHRTRRRLFPSPSPEKKTNRRFRAPSLHAGGGKATAKTGRERAALCGERTGGDDSPPRVLSLPSLVQWQQTPRVLAIGT